MKSEFSKKADAIINEEKFIFVEVQQVIKTLEGLVKKVSAIEVENQKALLDILKKAIKEANASL